MSPALIQLFAFMAATFLLGLFIGWALWRCGGVSRTAMEDLEAKAQFWKKSLDQSRMELWTLQDEHGVPRAKAKPISRPASRRRVTSRFASETPKHSAPSDSVRT